MDEQEIQRLMQQAMEEIRLLGAVSEDTAKKLKEATDETAKFKRVMRDSALGTARQLGGIAKAAAEGNTSFTIFNNAIDAVTGAVTKMAASLPLVGAAMTAVAEGSKFLLGQLQESTKAFQDMGQAGALGAQGMTGLRDQFTTAGLSMQSYVRVVSQASQAMAYFRGTSADGAADFAEVVGRLTKDSGPLGMGLRRIGLTADQIAESTADYIAIQTRLGRAQRMTNEELAAGAADYAKELDELSKLTGTSKDALKAQNEAMMREPRFRARLQELESQNRGDLIKGFRMLSNTVPELGDGLRDIIAGSGAITTQAAREVELSTRGAASRIVRAMEAGMIGPEEGARQLQAAVQQNVRSLSGLVKYTGNIEGVTVDFAKQANLASRSFGQAGRAAAIQGQQIAGTDGLTDAAVRAQQSIEKFAAGLNDISTGALEPAAKIIGKFTDVMVEAIGTFSEKTGITIRGGGGGGAVRVPANNQAAEAAAAAVAEFPQMALGGITSGPTLAGESGPEAVVPLPDGKKIPVEMQNARFNGMGMDGSYFKGGITTDTKLTDMIMQRLGLTDFDSKRMINLSGIGLNQQVGAAKFGSNMAPGVREALVDMVENLRNEGVSTQDALKATLDNFNKAMTGFLQSQAAGNNEGLAGVMMQLVDLQRQQNAISGKIARGIAN